MKTSLNLPLISFLAIGSLTLFADSALSGTIRFTNNTGSAQTVGYSFIYTGIDGQPLNIISSTSPEFPTTLIQNNNTSQVSLSRFGGPYAPNTPYSVESVIEDYPDGTFGYNTQKAVAVVATPTGTEEVNIGAFNFLSSASPNATTPFSAVQISADVEIDGTIFQRLITAQLPGDKINLSGFDIPDAQVVNISVKPIAEIVSFDQLGAFPTPQQFTLLPGGTLNIGGSPTASVPESQPITLIGLLSVAGLGVIGKKIKRN